MNQLISEESKETMDVALKFAEDPLTEIKCHSHILKSKSPYFEGLLSFVMEQSELDGQYNPTQAIKTLHIERYSPQCIKALIDYFYTGHCELDSNDIVEMFNICQEYMLPDLRQLLEQIMVGNLDMDNFPDCIQLARDYECKILREALYMYGRKNYNELYRKGQLKTLNKEEFSVIKP